MIDNTWSVLANTEVHYLCSEAVGDEFKILVAHPMVQLSPDQKVPVVYVLDANSNFGLVSDIIRGGALAGWPHAFVIGIGYRTDGMMTDAFVKRSRDYTPVAVQAFDSMGGLFAGLPEAQIRTGGAPSFLSFIKNELAPFLESRYSIDSSNRTVIGMSLGGLFAAWVLLSQPEEFERYLICSPSLWWDDDALMRKPPAWSEQGKNISARVFLAAGDLERDEIVRVKFESAPDALKPVLAALRNSQGKHLLAEHVEELAKRLTALQMPNLKVSCKIFDEETHESVYPSALSRGIGALFEPNSL